MLQSREESVRVNYLPLVLVKTAKITYTLEIRLTTKLNTLNQCTLKKVYLIIKINGNMTGYLSNLIWNGSGSLVLVLVL